MADIEDRGPPEADLAGRRILFIAPRFFGYEVDIASELERRDAVVDFIPDRPFQSPWLHALARFAPKSMRPLTRRYYRRKLNTLACRRYDHVFVLNGQTIPPWLLADLRKINPTARFTLYVWDSFRNRANVVNLLPLFDRAYCFEAEAAERHGLRFRPLFFAPVFEREGAAIPKPIYDISFIGTAHTDRYAVISKVDAALPKGTKRYWYLFLQAPWVLRAYRWIYPGMRHAREDEFRFTPLPKEESSRMFWLSRAILDVENPRQTGLTMRTLETLGARKKLITTNAGIVGYAFHDPRNIHVIDRDVPSIPDDFFRSEAQRLPDEIYRRYSLAGWIDEIFAEADYSHLHLKAVL